MLFLLPETNCCSRLENCSQVRQSDKSLLDQESAFQFCVQYVSDGQWTDSGWSMDVEAVWGRDYRKYSFTFEC